MKMMKMYNIDDRERSTMRSLERALHVLLSIGYTDRPVTVTDLSQTNELSKATILRLLAILEEYRFVEKIEGRYRLGLAVLPLAHTYLLRNELAQVAFPVMQEAVQVSGEALTLFVRFGFHRILIQRVERDYPLRRTSALIGQPLPLHLGLGKVLAAAMPREEVLQMLSSLDGEVRFANGKRWTRSTFLAELNVIRRQGYCVSFSERIVGSCGLAAPILNKNGETIAAIGLVTSEEQMTSKIIRNLSVDLRSIAKTISDLYDGV